MPTTFTSVKAGYGSIALAFMALAVSGLALFRNAVYVQAPITGTGSTIQVAVSPTKSGTGQVVDGWLVLTTQVSGGGCTATGGLAKYNTCFVGTGSALLGKNRDSTMSGRLIKSIAIFGDASPDGAVNIDCDFQRDASGSGTGGTLPDDLDNITVSTGSKLLINYTGSGAGVKLPVWDKYSNFKCGGDNDLGSRYTSLVFRVLINYMDQFDQ